MNWIRLVLTAAAVAAVAFGVQQLRAHWIGVGESTVQARWNNERVVMAAAAASQAAAANREALTRFRNSERNADEQDRLAQSRDSRLSSAAAESERLRRALAERDAAAPVPQTGDAGAAAFAREAATTRELLGSCQTRYLGVAKAAEELRDQVTGLLADAHVCRGTAGPSAEVTP